MAYQERALDLEQLFGSVLGTLQQNRQSLNQADDGNHDHGDNMVATFQTITRSVAETRGYSQSDQLAYAADSLSRSPSGSAQVYAAGLSQAAREFEGRQVTDRNAMNLIQALLGGGQPTPPVQQQSAGGMGDLLGTLLGGGQQPAPQQQQPQSTGGLGDLLGTLLGGGQQPAPQQQEPQSTGGLGDLLGTLLGGGQQPAPQQPQPRQDNGIDMGDILRGGLAYMSTKARGGGTLEALVNAVVAGSALGSGYRQQSSSLVVNALLTALQGMGGGR